MEATVKVTGIIQEHCVVIILAFVLGMLTGGGDILTPPETGSLTVLVSGFLGIAILISIIIIAIRESSLRATFNVAKTHLPVVAVVVLPYISGALAGWQVVTRFIM